MKKKSSFFVLVITVMLLIVTTTFLSFASEPGTEVDDNLSSNIDVLYNGSSGDNVTTLQENLIKLQFLDDVADGYFGNLTEAAVKDFQNEYGIETSGVVDTEIQNVLSNITNSIADSAFEEPDVIKTFRTAEIQHNADGHYYVAPNTVSEGTLSEAHDILLAITKAYNESAEIPEYDYVYALAYSNDSDVAPVYLTETFFDTELTENIVFTDIFENTVTITPDFVFESDTGHIGLQKVDIDTLEKIEDAFDTTLDEFENNYRPAVDSNVIYFRNTSIHSTEDGFVVDADTVSDKTLQEARNVYAAIRLAYMNSTDIPEDVVEEERAEAEGNDSSKDNDDVSNDSSVTRNNSNADNTNTNSTVTNNTNNNVSRDDTGQNRNTNTTTNNNAGTSNTTAPSSNPGSDTRQTGNNTNNNSNNNNSNNNNNSSVGSHEHVWVPVYVTVHHDAVTHQEPVYKTVHHDAVTHQEPIYESVYHPAVYEQKFLWYEQYSYTVIICHTCGQEFYSYSDYNAHDTEFGGWCQSEGYKTETRYADDTSKPVYENVCTQNEYYENVVTGYQTVVDTAAYDEQVLDSYKTVVDQAAYDSQELNYEYCSICNFIR